MIVSGPGSAAAYAAMKTSSVQRQTLPATAANYADRVRISDAAKSMIANSQEQEIQNRLDAIKTKQAVARTAEENEYLRKNDQRFIELAAKDPKTLTADEVDYMEKAGGLVNMMAELSPKEKALYDELIAKGNWEAALGLRKVGMARSGMSGQEVKMPNGRSFDPKSTEVTVDSVRNLFKMMFVNDPQSDRQFDALASHLEQRQHCGQASIPS